MELEANQKQKVTDSSSNIVLENKYFKVLDLPDRHTLLCEAKLQFIPTERFKESFEMMGDYIGKVYIQKMIFDKRKLKTFDQTSMTWYHIHWKAEMKTLGLKTYRKLLPDDFTFRMSVEIGRQKIAKDNPEFKFDNYDILYCDTLEEALEV
jgi:hypothetical protein